MVAGFPRCQDNRNEGIACCDLNNCVNHLLIGGFSCFRGVSYYCFIEGVEKKEDTSLVQTCFHGGARFYLWEFIAFIPFTGGKIKQVMKARGNKCIQLDKKRQIRKLIKCTLCRFEGKILQEGRFA